ncbi:MAG: hypothetical protein FWF82_03500, partial [Oscillospiraceae bacterium]|nr:hypothetical protein [Oscillospiraceae bacterium]
MKGKDIITHAVRGEMPDAEQMRENCIHTAESCGENITAVEVTPILSEKNRVSTVTYRFFPALIALVLVVGGMVGGGMFLLFREDKNTVEDVTNEDGSQSVVTTADSGSDTETVTSYPLSEGVVRKFNATYYRIDCNLEPQTHKILSVEDLKNSSALVGNDYMGKVNRELFDSPLYDDNFFAENFLVYIMFEVGSGSYRFNVTSLMPFGEEDTLTANIDLHTGGGTDDMAGWLIVLELDRRFSNFEIEYKLNTVEHDCTQLNPPADRMFMVNLVGINKDKTVGNTFFAEFR